MKPDKDFNPTVLGDMILSSLSGHCSPDQFTKLCEAVRSHDEARKYYAEYMQIYTYLYRPRRPAVSIRDYRPAAGPDDHGICVDKVSAESAQK